MVTRFVFLYNFIIKYLCNIVNTRKMYKVFVILNALNGILPEFYISC